MILSSSTALRHHATELCTTYEFPLTKISKNDVDPVLALTADLLENSVSDRMKHIPHFHLTSVPSYENAMVHISVLEV